MKRTVVAVIVLMLILPALAFASNPQRSVTTVPDVTKGINYNWIVKPGEEPKGDQTVSNAPETDIVAVSCVQDNIQLRFDIVLNSPVTKKLYTWFGIEIQYSNGTEYYLYKPIDDTFHYYWEDENGSITEDKEIDMSLDGDWAGLTTSGGKANMDVIMLINKADHITANSGDKVLLTVRASTGYWNNNDELKDADDTIYVDITFTM